MTKSKEPKRATSPLVAGNLTILGSIWVIAVLTVLLVLNFVDWGHVQWWWAYLVVAGFSWLMVRQFYVQAAPLVASKSSFGYQIWGVYVMTRVLLFALPLLALTFHLLLAGSSPNAVYHGPV